MAGGGQEGALRSGTENMSGIAALGAVLEALEDPEGKTFRSHAEMSGFRARLAAALEQAFPGLVYNAPLAQSLPTTLNFSVPGLSSRLLQDLFDAADVRVSGGSACSAAKAAPSFVLQAMGLPDWQAAGAVRLSIGPAVDEAFIAEACARIQACGESLRRNCMSPSDNLPTVGEGLSRFMLEGACCYVLADAAAQRCVLIDPLPEQLSRLAQVLRCQNYPIAAVLSSSGEPAHGEARALLAAELPDLLDAAAEIDALGWPLTQSELDLGSRRLRRVLLDGGGQALLLSEGGPAQACCLAFVGPAAGAGAGRADRPAGFDRTAERPGPAAGQHRGAGAWRGRGRAPFAAFGRAAAALCRRPPRRLADRCARALRAVPEPNA